MIDNKLKKPIDANKIDLLENNVRDLQEQIQNAYARIIQLTKGDNKL